jgi:sugar lactone lactonase YvrE
MILNNWEVVTAHRCLLGEGPVWDKNENRVLWVDILNGDINYYYPVINEHKVFNTGLMVGAVALRKSGGLIAAVKDGFAVIDLSGGTLELKKKIETHLPGNRFNDGKCDPAGRFWAGTMSMSDDPHAGSLYMLEKDFTVAAKITGVGCSNGLAWSPDNKTLYFIDTPTRHVIAYDYDITNGNITHKRIAVKIPETDGYPDGMTIDADGMLWIAIWDGWKIIRCNPYSGKRLCEIHFPAARITSCVFGGNTLEDLYITSARVGLTEQNLMKQPLSGSLFIIKNSGFKGIDAFEFDG